MVVTAPARRDCATRAGVGMVWCVPSLACCAACNAWSCCVRCCPSPCGRKEDVERGERERRHDDGEDDDGARRGVGWRGYYASGFVIIALLTWLLRDYTDTDSWGDMFTKSMKDCRDNGSCAHAIATRAGLGNVLFFAVMLVMSVNTRESDRASIRVKINAEYWVLKGVFWVGLMFAAFALPMGANDYDALVNVFRALAAVFLLIQAIVCLGWIYDLNDKLMEGIDEDNAGGSKSVWILAGTSLASYASALTLLAFLYKLWVPSSSCSRNNAIITCMVVLCVAFTVISLHGKVNGGVFTSGVTMFYCLYLIASALNSEPRDYRCSPVTSDGDLNSLLSFIGFMFALCALGKTAHSASSHSALQGDGDEDSPESPYATTYFHFVFLTASAYCAMVFVDWSGAGVTQGAGWTSVWVKVTLAYASAALYLWALVAPFVFKNRDF